MIERLKQHVLAGGMIDEEQAKGLAAALDKEALYEAAHQITRHFMGDKFDTCSIINAKSGNCSEDCKWCAQSGHYKTNVTLYPLLPAEECIRHATYNYKQGIGRFALVTSGKKVSDRDMVEITETVRSIKQACGIKCCASMGLLSREQLQALYDSGTENYHCNIETAPSYFHTLCTTHTIEQKLQTIRQAREIGFRICSGGIIGMGETVKQRDRDGHAPAKGRDSLYPLKPSPTYSRHTVGKDTAIDGRGVPNHHRTVSFHQPQSLPAFLRGAGQVERGGAAQGALHRYQLGDHR